MKNEDHIEALTTMDTEHEFMKMNTLFFPNLTALVEQVH